MKILRQTLALIACFTLAGALAGAAEAPEDFVGQIIDVAGSVPGRSTAHVRIHIDEYATAGEVQELAALLVEQGPEALLKKLRKLDRGWISVGSHLGYPLSVARSIETEDGRVIRVVTDRPIQMFELMRGLRSQDHAFGLFEITLDAAGEGEGQLIAAAKVEFTKKGQIEIESLGTKPFKLSNVRVEKPKAKKK